MNKLLILLLACLTLTASGAPTLEIFEFGTKTPVVSKKLSGKSEKISTKKWNCQVSLTAGKINVWNLKFNSSLHEPVKLAVRFSVPLTFKAERFWDGFKEHKVEKLPMERKEFLEAFPLAVAEDGKNGFALGFSPENILSQFSRKLTNKEIILEARIVVDDRKEQKLSITEYTFTPEFGWKNAVEDYQNAFMSYFIPEPGIDKRIYGVGGYINGAHMQRPFQLNAQRFSGIEWEWTYAPWYESGNWYPVGDGWKTEKNEYRHYYRYRGSKMLTKQEYDDVLRKEIHYGNKIAAMFYYILVKDIHQNVAKDYPQTDQGNSGLHSLPSNTGKTRSVYAPGSPLFDYLKKQLKAVVDNYEVSGFSYDMANSSYHFTTPSQLEYAVGRSWYDNGKIYTSDSVLPIFFADYVNTLKRDGKTMGNIFNAALSNFSPFTLFHGDAAIMEGAPYYNVNMIMPLRLIMGKKPTSFWHGIPDNPSGVMTALVANDPERKAKVSEGLRQFYLLKCYEFGFTPMNWNTIHPYYQPHLPVIRALSEAGYHPVPAIKGAEPFWYGRFGDGIGTILTFSNPKREKITRTIRVITRYIGKNKYAFLPAKGELKQKFVNGETVFDLTLEPKEVIALRTIQINGNATEITAAAAPKNISLQGNAPFEFSLKDKDFYGNTVQGGKNGIFSGKAEKNIEIALQNSCGIFAPENSMTSLLDAENMPSIEAGNDNDTQIAAETLAIYRPHVAASRLFKNQINNREPGFMDSSFAKPDLKVFAPGKAPAGKKICIGTAADFPNFKVPENFADSFLSMIDSNTLWIGGRTPAEVRKAANVYFNMLDKRQTAVEKVNFKRPSGWGQGKFVNGDKQKYLQIEGDPSAKNNNWRYAWYSINNTKAGDELSFSISCKIEKITSGTVQLGIWEFADELGRKHIKFNAVPVKAAPGWQTVSGKVKLSPKTKTVRFYFLCRNLGKGDIFQVRSFEWINNSKIK